ncbi:flagellar FliL protein [Alkalibacterium subtropicum]|uniref:Flagellar protein FliL n=1 Tax=Alkalibacterium subtropicum TaxID=753702 RepID=A0A1I1IWA5_9LACT|nr:flagellar basal body-associated FliL family protein [Alkalibacterium subtropicum]SFC40567.1 flagellar FliL protein [Alkalibacterium subtropicum]
MAQKNEAEKKIKKGSKLLIVGGLVVLLLFAGIGIGGFVFASQEDESFVSRFTPEAEAVEISFPLEEFLINLSSESERNQPVVRMELTITSLNEEAEELFGKEIAKVRDAVIHVVANQSVETIYNEEEGHFLIKNDIKKRINQALEDDVVEDVFITNILLQK